MKTYIMAAAVAATIAASVGAPAMAADPYAIVSAGSFAVTDGTRVDDFGVGLGLSFAEVGIVDFAVEGVVSATGPSANFEVTMNADVTAVRFSNVSIDVGAFAGVEWFDVGNTSWDNNDWVYGVQASFGTDVVALRTRVYLEDTSNVTANVGVMFSF